MKTNIEQKRKFIDNQDEDLIESMLLLHTSCAKYLWEGCYCGVERRSAMCV